MLELHYSHARGNFAVTRVKKKGQKANNFTLVVKRGKWRMEGSWGVWKNTDAYKNLFLSYVQL